MTETMHSEKQRTYYKYSTKGVGINEKKLENHFSFYGNLKKFENRLKLTGFKSV